MNCVFEPCHLYAYNVMSVCEFNCVCVYVFVCLYVWHVSCANLVSRNSARRQYTSPVNTLCFCAATLVTPHLSPSDSMMESKSECNISSMAVKVELPSFDRSDIDTWLAMCDNLLEDAGVRAQSTKFRKVLSKLPPEQFRLVKDLVTSPLGASCYDALTKRLRSRLQLTASERFQRFESLPRELGSRKPTELYADLAALYPNDTDHEIVREAFLCRLPSNLQMMCREWLTSEALSEVALRADQHNRPLQVSTTSSVISSDAPSTPSDNTCVVAATRVPNTRTVSQKTTNPPDFVDRWCRLHRRFGPAARRCLGRCTFTSDMSGNAPGSRQ